VSISTAPARSHQQDTPRYSGSACVHRAYLIPAADYFRSAQQGVIPGQGNQLALPFSVAYQQSRTIYITFIGSYPANDSPERS
jgi:hypothetical protein